jgi:hypothetical protein
MKIANYVYIINIADYLAGDEIMQEKIKIRYTSLRLASGISDELKALWILGTG